jgi:2-polyprenyl-6-methoxyphenol hydroxylase-like FAD-dependent oxidoreductase
MIVNSSGRPASATSRTPVLIVGAGPVGCVLALELARHEVPSILLERSLTPSRYPKMDYINGRSMELLRRLGIAGEIRERGVSPHLPSNLLWTRGFEEPPIALWEYASPAELMKRAAEINDGSVPVEPYQRMQGSLLEEIVRRHVRETKLIDFREGLSFTGLRQDALGADVDVLDAAGRRHMIRADYVAACDGAGSQVRQNMGIPMEAMSAETTHCSVYFKSSDPVLRKYGRAFVTISARGLNLISRDEEDTWTGSFVIPDGDAQPKDPIASIRERLGADFAVDEVLNVSQWQGTLSVARSYRLGSAFLVGDSAHQFYPVGGHGANTGIADAVDLGWKLAGRVRGWGGSSLLDSYEAERRPVALFTREMCANLLEVYRRFPRLVDQGATRQQLAGFLDEEIYQLDNVGIHFGYRYAASPVVLHEDAPEPDWRWRRITPTTWPGVRAPAVRLADGTQLFDRLGPGFTLVDLSGRALGEPVVKEAARRSVPMTHLHVDDADVRACWERDLVLVRPDQHVAWRADRVPDDPETVVARVTGHSAPEIS